MPTGDSTVWQPRVCWQGWQDLPTLPPPAVSNSPPLSDSSVTTQCQAPVSSHRDGRNSLLGVSLFSLLFLTGYSHCSHTHDPLEKEITHPSTHAPACKLYNGFLLVGNKVHNHFRGLWGLLGPGPYFHSSHCCNHIPSSFCLLQPPLLPVSGTRPATSHPRAFAPTVPYPWDALHCTTHLANPSHPSDLSLLTSLRKIFLTVPPIPQPQASGLFLHSPRLLHFLVSFINL